MTFKGIAMDNLVAVSDLLLDILNKSLGNVELDFISPQAKGLLKLKGKKS